MFAAASFDQCDNPRRLSDPDATIHLMSDAPGGRHSLATLIKLAGWRVTRHASLNDFLARPSDCAGCLVLEASAHDPVPHDICFGQIALPVVMIGRSDVMAAVKAVRAGAFEFIPAPVSTWALLRAIDEAVDVSREMLEGLLYVRELRARFASLSLRERQVLSLLVQGLLNKQVGGELGISEITVKAHRGQMMRKMRARSFAELVTMAGDLELIRTPIARSRPRDRYHRVGQTKVQ